MTNEKILDFGLTNGNQNFVPYQFWNTNEYSRGETIPMKNPMHTNGNFKTIFSHFRIFFNYLEKLILSYQEFTLPCQWDFNQTSHTNGKAGNTIGNLGTRWLAESGVYLQIKQLYIFSLGQGCRTWVPRVSSVPGSDALIRHEGLICQLFPLSRHASVPVPGSDFFFCVPGLGYQPRS